MSVFHEIKIEQAHDEAHLLTDAEIHPQAKDELIGLLRTAWEEVEDLPEERTPELIARVDTAFETICGVQNLNAELQKAHPEGAQRLRRIYRLTEEAANSILQQAGYTEAQRYAFGSASDSPHSELDSPQSH